MHSAHTSALLLALVLGLSSCGGGVWFGFGPGDDPPEVALAVAPLAARAGEAITLSASANDDFAVFEVGFYRLDRTGRWDLIGVDRDPPYLLTTLLPAGAASPVRYLARARDDAGQSGDSAVAEVAVLP